MALSRPTLTERRLEWILASLILGIRHFYGDCARSCAGLLVHFNFAVALRFEAFDLSLLERSLPWKGLEHPFCVWQNATGGVRENMHIPTTLHKKFYS